MERQSVPAKNWEPGGIDDLTLPPITEDIASTSSISGSGKSSPRADHTKGPVRVDMQMGRCRWIRVYDNVTYIVAGIVIRNSSTNGDFEVLLIQEAKQKCRGKWYMPAGHVEPGETIDEACRREMLEETGFECQVESLICMEVRGSGWFRMAFTCQIIGGTIKTTADDESLASGWFSLASIRDRSSGLQLRCRDFMNILDAAVYFEEWKKSIPQQLVESGKQRWKPIINRDEAQPGLFIEFVIIKTSTLTEKVDCLVHRSMTDELQLLDNQLVIEAFPCVEFGFEYFFPIGGLKMLQTHSRGWTCNVRDARSSDWNVVSSSPSVKH